MATLEWKDITTTTKVESGWFWVASASILAGIIIGFVIGKIII